jgi:hypothetical protein
MDYTKALLSAVGAFLLLSVTFPVIRALLLEGPPSKDSYSLTPAGTVRQLIPAPLDTSSLSFHSTEDRTTVEKDAGRYLVSGTWPGLSGGRVSIRRPVLGHPDLCDAKGDRCSRLLN